MIYTVLMMAPRIAPDSRRLVAARYAWVMDMTETELANYLIEDQQTMTAIVNNWLSTSHSFRAFAERNRDKIRRKFRNASEIEDQRDVLAELEFAHDVMADPRFEVEYEPDGHSACRNPDFLVTSAHAGAFNLEVKRVRQSEATRKLQSFEHAVVDGIRAVPSSLGVSLSLLGDDAPVVVISRLSVATSQVVAEIAERIRRTEGTLSHDEDVSFCPDGFDGQLKVIISRGEQSPTAPTAYFGGTFMIPYTQREGFKFSDILCGCLGQMRPGMANVLAVRVHSDTHESQDLPLAIIELSNKLVLGDNAYFQSKGFANGEEFRRQFQKLSAVVVKSNWGSKNYLLLIRGATMPLPMEAAHHLSAMPRR